MDQVNQFKANDEIEIDLGQIFSALIKKLWLIIIAFIIGAGIGYFYTENYVTPLYQSDVKLYINSNSDFSVSGLTSFTTSSISTSAGLVDTYIVILQTRNTLEDVIEEAGLPYTYNQLLSMISASSVNGTAIFNVTVTSSNPAEAQLIANTIASILPTKIADIIDGSLGAVVDYAVVSTSPTLDNTTKNTILGAMIGAMFVIAIVVLRQLLNQEIKSENELVAMFNIPVLANIPDYNVKASGYYSEYAKAKSEVNK